MPTLAQIKALMQIAEEANQARKAKTIMGAERQANLDRFLEGSQIKDKMYRGATPDFYKEGIPIFVSPTVRFAEKFPVGSLNKGNAVQQNQTIFPLHVNATNPFDYTNPEHVKKVIYQISKSDPEVAEKIENEFSHYQRLAEKFGDQHNNWGLIERPHVQDAIKQLGHDSFYVNEEGVKNLGVFNPEQIKSAIGNEGTFDPTNPNITKADGGMIHMQVGGGVAAMKAALKLAEEAKQAKLAQDLARAKVTVPNVMPEQAGNYKALPLRLPRATPKKPEEIDALAKRMADQQLGLHVTSGKQGDTRNLAGRSMKENERVKGIDYNLEPTGTVAEPVRFIPKEGDVIMGLPGDQTIADFNLKTLNGKEINSAQTGGGKYGMGQRHHEDPKFWNSDEQIAKIFQNKVNDLGRFADVNPEAIYGEHMAMGTQSNNFAQHFADANLKAIDLDKMTPEQINSFNNLIREGWSKVDNKAEGGRKYYKFPDFPGIEKPNESYLAMLENPEMRKYFNNRMKIPAVTEAHGLPNGLDVEWAITEPAIRNSEVSTTGLAAGRLTPFRTTSPDPSYPMYGTAIHGVGIGPAEALKPVELAFPDATQHIMSTQKPSDFTGTIQKVFPHQKVDDQYLNELGEYQNKLNQYLKQGTYKKGGAVHMAEGGDPQGSVSVEGAPAEFNNMQPPSQDEMRLALVKANTQRKPEQFLSQAQAQPQAIPEANLQAKTILAGRGAPVKPFDISIVPGAVKGLGNMLAGAGRGIVGSTVGMYGDIEGMIRSGVNSALNTQYDPAGNPIVPEQKQPEQNVVSQETVLPKTEDVLKNLPSPPTTQEGNFGQLAGTMMPFTPNAVGKVIGATKDLPIGLGIKNVAESASAPSNVAPKLLSPKDELGFYSNVEKAALNLKRASGNGQSYVNDLLKQPGVTKNELEAIGLPEFLASKKMVTTPEVQDFVKNNRLKLKETYFEGSKEQDIEDWLENEGIQYPSDSAYESARVNVEHYNKLDKKEYPKYGPDEYGEYMTPGGKNYREQIIQLPERQISEVPKIDTSGWTVKNVETHPVTGQRTIKVLNENGSPLTTRSGFYGTDEEAIRAHAYNLQRLEQEDAVKAKNFKEGHYSEHPNTLLNMRMDDRTDIEGKSGTLLDELQSDWHQKGREKGYGVQKRVNPQEMDNLMTEINNALREKFRQTAIDVGIEQSKADELAVAYTRVNTEADKAKEVGRYDEWKELSDKLFQQSRGGRGVPDAPFKENWHELGIKKAIIDAVNRGDERLYMPTGKDVAERYNLSKQISRLNYTEDGTLRAFDHNGEEVINRHVSNPDELEGIIGKEPAKRLMEQEPTGIHVSSINGRMIAHGNPNVFQGRELTGVDLDVGGQGMKKYYDEIYPSALKKFAKQYGGHVGTTEILTSPKVYHYVDENGHLVHSKEFKTLRDAQRNMEGLKINGLIPQDSQIKEFHGATRKVYYYEPDATAIKKIKGGVAMKKGGIARMNEGGKPILPELLMEHELPSTSPMNVFTTNSMPTNQMIPQNAGMPMSKASMARLGHDINTEYGKFKLGTTGVSANNKERIVGVDFGYESPNGIYARYNRPVNSPAPARYEIGYRKSFSEGGKPELTPYEKFKIENAERIRQGQEEIANRNKYEPYKGSDKPVPTSRPSGGAGFVPGTMNPFNPDSPLNRRDGGNVSIDEMRLALTRKK